MMRMKRGGQWSPRTKWGVLKSQAKKVFQGESDQVCQLVLISQVRQAWELTFGYGNVEATGGFDKNQFSSVVMKAWLEWVQE